MPGIHLPTAEWGYFKTKLGSGHTAAYLNCSALSCRFMGLCANHSADFRPLAFNFGDNKYYQVMPADYLLNVKDA